MLHAGFGGGVEERPRLALLALVCWEAARRREPLREDSGGTDPTFSFRQQKTNFPWLL